MDEKETMTKAVYDILKPFAKSVDPEKSMLVRDAKGVLYSGTFEHYVFNYYQSMISSRMVLKMPMYHIIRRSVYGDESCDLDLRIFLGYYQFGLERRKLQTFLMDVHQAVNRCDVVSIHLTIHYREESHLNILVLNKQYNQICGFLYDPHGSAPRFERDEGFFSSVDRFLVFFQGEYLQTTHQHMYANGTRRSVSCPDGLQRVSEDPIGFCIMINYLWLYVVFHLLRRKFPIDDVMIRAEQMIIDSITRKRTERLRKPPPNAQLLYSTILNFSMFVVDTYTASLPPVEQRYLIDTTTEQFLKHIGDPEDFPARKAKGYPHIANQ